MKTLHELNNEIDECVKCPFNVTEKELGFGLCLSGEYKDRQVYFKKYSGDEIEKDGKTIFVVDEEDLLAFVE